MSKLHNLITISGAGPDRHWVQHPRHFLQDAAVAWQLGSARATRGGYDSAFAQVTDLLGPLCHMCGDFQRGTSMHRGFRKKLKLPSLEKVETEGSFNFILDPPCHLFCKLSISICPRCLFYKVNGALSVVVLQIAVHCLLLFC